MPVPTFTKVRICNLKKRKCREYKALVDTGSTLIDVPEEIAKEIELEPESRPNIDFYLGGKRIIPQIAIAEVTIMNRTMIDPVTVGIFKEPESPVVGYLALESRGLMVDPTTCRIKPRKGFPRV